ncbi:MAG: hypothetical protein IT337_18530 [Thermomicrobiales bacterium]|nr:hypothetical protein [Thermomicrobiales bacterium]
MSDDLRERIALAIARVPAGKAADAVLDAIAETAVIVERERLERVLAYLDLLDEMMRQANELEALARCADAALQPGDLEVTGDGV